MPKTELSGRFGRATAGSIKPLVACSLHPETLKPETLIPNRQHCSLNLNDTQPDHGQKTIRKNNFGQRTPDCRIELKTNANRPLRKCINFKLWGG